MLGASPDCKAAAPRPATVAQLCMLSAPFAAEPTSILTRENCTIPRPRMSANTQMVMITIAVQKRRTHRDGRPQIPV